MLCHLVVFPQHMRPEVSFVREGCFTLTASQGLVAVSLNVLLQVVALQKPPATNLAQES